MAEKMTVHVPEMDDDLRVLPQDTYLSNMADLFLGKGKTSDKAKLTAKWIITTECTDPAVKKAKDKDGNLTYESTVGAVVLDDYSLQQQAIWKLAGLWKQVTGEKLPHGDYDLEEFHTMMKEQLVGIEAKLDIVDDDYTGEVRSKVDKVLVV